MTAALLERAGTRDRRLPVAARRSLAASASDRRRRDRPEASSRRRSSGSRQPSPAVERALEDGDAVTQFEADHRRRLRRVRRGRRRGGGDRGRPRRPPRRDQRAPVAGHGADLDRARAHASSSATPSRRSPTRSSPCSATTRRWSPAALDPVVLEARPRARPPSAHARIVEAARPAPGAAPGGAPYLRRNLGGRARRRRGDRRADRRRCRARVAAALPLPGRMEVLGGRPAADPRRRPQPRRGAALAEALPSVAAGRPVVACVAILAGKDAAGIIAALAPALDAVVCTRDPPATARGLGPARRRRPSRRASWRGSPRAAGVAEVEESPTPRPAVARARELARARGRGGARRRFALPSWLWIVRLAPSCCR